MSDNEITLKASISTTPNLAGNIVTGQTKVATNDHNLLIHRDLPDQHPIGSIAGLQEELLSIKKVEEKINNKIRTVKSIPDDMQVGEYIFLEKESE